MRAWGGHTFSYVAHLRAATSKDGRPLEFLPQARYAKASLTQLHRYGSGPFCKFQIPWSFSGAGVYILCRDDQVLYVGECAHLAQRFNMGYGSIQPKNCYVGGQQTNCRLNMLVLQEAKEGHSPELWFCGSDHRKEIEKRLIQELRPRWNR